MAEIGRDKWFVPKTHGYGAHPQNWRGWALTLGFVALEVWLAWTMIITPAQLGLGPSFMGVLVWLALTTGLAVAFIMVCESKTDGEWRWRWGSPE